MSSERQTEQTQVKIVTSVITNTTVVEVMSSSVSPGPVQEVDGSASKFHSLYEMAMEMIDAHQRNTVCHGEIQPEDVKGDLQDNAMVTIMLMSIAKKLKSNAVRF